MTLRTLRIERPPLTESVRLLEERLGAWAAKNAATLTRLSLGIVFLWFGALKLFPGVSPAEQLAGGTITALTHGLVDPQYSVPLLGVWESLMGIGLLTGRALRLTLVSFFAHMIGTVTPVALCPEEVFAQAPLALTLEGQYIVKNLVLIGAAVVVAAARGRR